MEAREPALLAPFGVEVAALPEVAQALRLPAAERLQLMLHAPAPMRLVRTLPDADLYLTIREVGPADALPMLALSSVAGCMTTLTD